VLDTVPPPLRWAHAFLAIYSGEMEAGFALATVAAEEAAAAGDDRSRASAPAPRTTPWPRPGGAQVGRADRTPRPRLPGDVHRVGGGADGRRNSTDAAHVALTDAARLG